MLHGAVDRHADWRRKNNHANDTDYNLWGFGFVLSPPPKKKEQTEGTENQLQLERDHIGERKGR